MAFILQIYFLPSVLNPGTTNPRVFQPAPCWNLSCACYQIPCSTCSMAGLRPVPGSPSAFSGFPFSRAMCPDGTTHHHLKDHKSLSCTWPPETDPAACFFSQGIVYIWGRCLGFWKGHRMTLPPLEMPYAHTILDIWSVTKYPLCHLSPRAN